MKDNRKKRALDKVGVVKRSDVAHAKVDLPPAGHKRDEELRRREDNLAQAADEMEEHVEVGAGDLAGLKPEPEIMKHFDPTNQLSFEGKQEGYEYKWTLEKLPSGANSMQVELAQSYGWEVVTKAMPEAHDKPLDPRGYRKVGDTLLMRIPTKRFEAIEAYEAEMRRERHDPMAIAQKMAQQYHGIAAVHVDPDKDPLAKRAFDRAAKAGIAGQIATKQFTQKIKDGALKVPMAHFQR